jgi:integrase
MNAEIRVDVAASPITVAAAVGAYLHAYEGRDESRPARLGEGVQLLGDRPRAALTADEVEAALGSIAGQPAARYCGRDKDRKPIFKVRAARRSGGTVNRYRAAFAALFSWCRRNRLVPRDAESPLRFTYAAPESRGRVRFLSDDERAALLAACRGSSWPRLWLLVAAAITTGARRGELLALRWRDVDLDRREATLHDTKNGDRRMLVLLPNVVEEMRRFAPANAAESDHLVFRSRLRPGQPFSVAKVFNEAVAAAGIRDFRFHDLRHSCASYLAQGNASLVEIADTLGHRTMRMVQRYSHLSVDSRRRLVERLLGDKL